MLYKISCMQMLLLCIYIINIGFRPVHTNDVSTFDINMIFHLATQSPVSTLVHRHAGLVRVVVVIQNMSFRSQLCSITTAPVHRNDNNTSINSSSHINLHHSPLPVHGINSIRVRYALQNSLRTQFAQLDDF